MGRMYLQHFGGLRLFSCGNCDTFLTNRDEIMSVRFTGSTGRAYLFKKVANLIHCEAVEREMLTGRHWVRDVRCKNCKEKLGWMYEFAVEEKEKYKESHVILEKALIREKDGFIEDTCVARA